MLSVCMLTLTGYLLTAWQASRTFAEHKLAVVAFSANNHTVVFIVDTVYVFPR